MATTNEAVEFTREDIVYDNDCIAECGNDEPLKFVNREDPEEVIHESCFFKLKPRERDEFIAIAHVPSGKPTPEQRIDAAVAEELDAEEYDIDSPVEVDIAPNAGSND